jgi:hypothetical protein
MTEENVRGSKYVNVLADNISSWRIANWLLRRRDTVSRRRKPQYKWQLVAVGKVRGEKRTVRLSHEDKSLIIFSWPDLRLIEKSLLRHVPNTSVYILFFVIKSDGWDAFIRKQSVRVTGIKNNRKRYLMKAAVLPTCTSTTINHNRAASHSPLVRGDDNGREFLKFTVDTFSYSLTALLLWNLQSSGWSVIQ